LVIISIDSFLGYEIDGIHSQRHVEHDRTSLPSSHYPPCTRLPIMGPIHTASVLASATGQYCSRLAHPMGYDGQLLQFNKPAHLAARRPQRMVGRQHLVGYHCPNSSWCNSWDDGLDCDDCPEARQGYGYFQHDGIHESE
jgi:hypothetical protein